MSPVKKRNIREEWVCPQSNIDLTDMPKYEDIKWCVILFYDDGDHELSQNMPSKKQTQDAYKKFNCRGLLF